MIFIPIDRDVNSKRLLSTNSFQTKKWHNEELVWLIKYLTTLGKSNDDIYETWKYFYKKDKPDYEEADYQIVFKSFVKNSVKSKRVKYNKPYIYQEEVDYINSLPVPLWIRQYMFIILLHSRTVKQEEFMFFQIDEYKHFLSIKNTNISLLQHQISKWLSQYNFAKKIEVKEHYDVMPDSDYGSIEYDVDCVDIKFLIRSPVNNCSNKIKFETILDALNNINIYIVSEMVCPICGERFLIKPKQKLYICDNCYKKHRQEAWRAFKKKIRMSTGKS